MGDDLFHEELRGEVPDRYIEPPGFSIHRMDGDKGFSGKTSGGGGVSYGLQRIL